MRILIFSLLICMTLGADAAPKKSKRSKSNKTTKSLSKKIKKVKKSPWGASGSLTQVVPARTEGNQITSIGTSLSYKINKSNSAFLSQAGTKLYEVDENAEEFLFSDTVLGHSFAFKGKFLGFKTKLGSSLTLPASKSSRDNGVITKVTEKISFSRSLVKNFLSVSFSPYGRYHFNEYGTNLDGKPLRLGTIGSSLSLSLKPAKKTSMWFTAGAASHVNEADASELSHQEINSAYMFDAGLSYSFGKSLTLSTGFSQGNSMMSEGIYQVYVFDEEYTNYYLGLSTSI